jgi:nucleotide-binding universal stress UspA family protein
VDRDGEEARRVAGLAGAFLAAHEQPHRVTVIGSSMPPAEVLVDEMRRRRPRMLVIGAHGHHPVRDLFGTFVTRAMLAACPVPAFVGA